MMCQICVVLCFRYRHLERSMEEDGLNDEQVSKVKTKFHYTLYHIPSQRCFRSFQKTGSTSHNFLCGKNLLKSVTHQISNFISDSGAGVMGETKSESHKQMVLAASCLALRFKGRARTCWPGINAGKLMETVFDFKKKTLLPYAGVRNDNIHHLHHRKKHGRLLRLKQDYNV